MGLAQPVNDCQDADDDQPRAHEDVANKKDHNNKVADDLHARESDRVGQGAQMLPKRQRRHDFRGGLAHERGDGDDGVAVGAQRVDQNGQRGNSGRAVAAAIVHEDDGAAELRLGLHDLQLSRERIE